MGRLDLPDKPVDWVCVTKEYLAELYATIKAQKNTIETLEAEQALAQEEAHVA
jgi:hypothetical protein